MKITKTTLSKDSLNSIVIKAIDFTEFILKKEHNIDLTNEQEDILFENLFLAFDKIFPETDYQNFN